MSIPNIDHLEFEGGNQNKDDSNEEELGFDNVNNINEETQSEDNDDDDSSNINKSIKIVEVLKEKAKEHNSKNPSQKVDISQLRAVFCRGAAQHQGFLYITLDKCLFSLARVNMHLRQKTGEVIKISNLKEKRFIFELDISESFLPNEEDVTKAKADMEKYEVNFDFESINDLYLDVEPIKMGDFLDDR